MRHIYLLISFLLTVGLNAFAQADSSKPVNWTFAASKPEDGKVKISMKAVISKGWKLFSTTAADDEPNSRVVIDTGIQSKVISIREEGNLQQQKEPLFDNLVIRYFENDA